MTLNEIKSRWLTAAMLITILAIVPACEVLMLDSSGDGSEAVDPNLNYISRQWVDVLDDYGLVAICPPQEDVRVGDMFLFAEEPDNTFTTPGQSARPMATASARPTRPVRTGRGPTLTRTAHATSMSTWPTRTRAIGSRFSRLRPS